MSNKFVPYDKMSKKSKRAYDRANRVIYTKNVCTVPHKSIKDYDRSDKHYLDELYEDDYEDNYENEFYY